MRSPEEHKIFLDERRLQEANSRKVIEQFDKAVMTLAAGGLSMSLLFIEKVAHEPKQNSLPWLYTGWSFFTLSLLLSLVSFLCGYHSYRRELEILDELFKNPQLQSLPNKWSRPTLVINWLSAIALIVGAGAIVRFAILNQPNHGRNANMSESKQEQSVRKPVVKSAASIGSSQAVFKPTEGPIPERAVAIIESDAALRSSQVVFGLQQHSAAPMASSQVLFGPRTDAPVLSQPDPTSPAVPAPATPATKEVSQ